MKRREIASRSNSAIQKIAKGIGATAVTPNQISLASVAASGLVPLGLIAVGGQAGILVAIAGIQLRLLANVLDGLVAVEGGKATPTGALYNEFPDRVADSIILVTLGYSAGVDWLGWLAALIAALTAYVRVFGGALGLAQEFSGPMAKQHRMFVATGALGFGLLEPLLPQLSAARSLQFGLALIALGSVLTCVNRTRQIAKALEERAR